MLPTLVYRTLRSADFRCVRKFAWNFGGKGLLISAGNTRKPEAVLPRQSNSGTF